MLHGLISNVTVPALLCVTLHSRQEATAAGSQEAGFARDGQVEHLGEVACTHHFTKVAGILWHFVEAGRGEPIVFVHGLPESWFSWHYQLEALAKDYRVIAIDRKGCGQSDKSDGDYRAETVADEIVALMDAISVGRFNLVSHDWGTLVSDAIAANHPERVLRYVRMQAPLHIIEDKHFPQFRAFRDPAVAQRLLGNPAQFVNDLYGRTGQPARNKNTVQQISDADLDRITKEFSYPGNAPGSHYYFRDNPPLETYSARKKSEAARMTMPVLLLQADNDSHQPRYYFEEATRFFPDARIEWVANSGHFSELEQPAAVSAAIRKFYSATTPGGKSRDVKTSTSN